MSEQRGEVSGQCGWSVNSPSGDGRATWGPGGAGHQAESQNLGEGRVCGLADPG